MGMTFWEWTRDQVRTVVDSQAVGAIDGSVGNHRQRRVVSGRVCHPVLGAARAEIQ